MMAGEIRHATQADDYLNVPTVNVIHDWPSTRAEIKDVIQPYWPFHDDMTVVFGIEIKGRKVIGPASLQQRPLCSYTSTTWAWKK